VVDQSEAGQYQLARHAPYFSQRASRVDSFSSCPFLVAHHLSASGWVDLAGLERWTPRPGVDQAAVARAAVEAWRSSLSLGERLHLNHPNGVWRRWQASKTSKPAPAASRAKGKHEDNLVTPARCI
jgi:hypothetical protein